MKNMCKIDKIFDNIYIYSMYFLFITKMKSIKKLCIYREILSFYIDIFHFLWVL